jgi:hypothetical protein
MISSIGIVVNFFILMKLIKQITASEFFRKCIAFVGAMYIKLVYKTSKVYFVKTEIIDKAIESKTPLIIAFWHGHMAMLPSAWRWKKTVHMLLSQHRDGLLISRVLRHFNILSIFGSSTRGGIGAGINIIKAMENGDAIGITPDGPRGPTQVCSKGVITLAHIASEKLLKNVLIVPVTYTITRKKVLKSWDNFIVPLPFSRISFCCGDPLEISFESFDFDEEKMRITLENSLNDLHEKTKV